MQRPTSLQGRPRRRRTAPRHPARLRRPKPKPDPDNPGQFLPNGAAAKSGLNRSIRDAGWGQFVSILRAKAEDAGRTWIEFDPRHTSDRCEACQHAHRGTARQPSGIRLSALRAHRTS
ncbi:MAG TPA: zinc ribbon domain-containing protein [Mycobacterium sp.]|nr:zinc ribbon domain-containing protein [Mycobacterium sp.]